MTIRQISVGAHAWGQIAAME
ncbi:hypothetical protein BN381_350121 [Candidatus Microthrix parvicella RN1]|uniref:Uncharacterized protein n=1 Tax=Candidatus Neomicrothrix parvicella RN1 TaxID=1229780 RepID=R4Z4P3_9ACTN|nr:hypothetical protein BN381_350121 [Candidatus Microthrix parvicella RN1]